MAPLPLGFDSPELLLSALHTSMYYHQSFKPTKVPIWYTFIKKYLMKYVGWRHASNYYLVLTATSCREFAIFDLPPPLHVFIEWLLWEACNSSFFYLNISSELGSIWCRNWQFKNLFQASFNCIRLQAHLWLSKLGGDITVYGGYNLPPPLLSE